MKTWNKPILTDLSAELTKHGGTNMSWDGGNHIENGKNVLETEEDS